MNILMLDLEGVLIFSERMCLMQEDFKGDSRKYVLGEKRNYAQEFVDFAVENFDEVYLNTCVREVNAQRIMRWKFNQYHINYWDWHGKKTAGYESLEGNNVVHVEDGAADEERSDMKRLGIHYVEVQTAVSFLEYGESNTVYHYESDNELLLARAKIENIF